MINVRLARGSAPTPLTSEWKPVVIFRSSTGPRLCLAVVGERPAFARL